MTIGSLGRLFAELDTLAREGRLSDPAGRPLDVYLTEYGLFARGRRALGPAERARRLAAAFATARSAYPRVRQMLQYLLVEPPPGSPGGQFDTGLVARDGAPTPAFGALAALARAAAPRPR